MFLGNGLRVRTGLRAGENTGGGAGSGGGAGGLSQEVWDAIDARINPMIQGAVTSMSKRIEKLTGDKLTEAFGGFEKKLEGLVKGGAGGGEGGEGGGGGGDGGAKGGKQSKTDLELATLRRQNELHEKALRDLQAERDAERAKNRASEFRTKVTEGLAQHANVNDPFMSKLALSYLKDEGRIQHEEDGSIVFVDSSGNLPLDMGLKTWAKSDEAKRFQAPTGSKGSGSRPGGSPNVDPSKLTHEDRMRFLNEALDDAVSTR